jgi:SAM-dependent methyltransferase
MTDRSETRGATPGEGLSALKMPGYSLLGRLGKRVLRPGGRELTRWMLAALDIGPRDAVVELAPGLGATARMTLARNPASYTAIERDPAAAESTRRSLNGAGREVRVGSAQDTGLPDGVATVVYGEALLTMQRPETKTEIVREAHRLLRPGGRYAIHELCLVPDGLSEGERGEITEGLARTIRVGARPLTCSEWRSLLEAEGFSVRVERTVPMRLLEPGRLLRDEGPVRALRFTLNLLRHPVALRRVWAMRREFRRRRDHLGAVALVATKPSGGDG